MNPQIRTIGLPDDELLLREVAELWRAEKKTLGFFPEAALADYAQRGGILCATDDQGRLVGYLLLYRSKMAGLKTAHIVHLCVDSPHRGHGIARQLVSAMRDVTRTCLGAIARCRRDYPANSLWPRLGFLPIRETTGKAGLPMTEWWLDYGHPDLVSQIIDAELENKIITAIDACVFYSIHDDNSVDNVESQALLADWIPDSIALCVTPELRNEINRCQDKQRREQGRQAFRCFTELRGSPDVLEDAVNSLRVHFPQVLSVSDESDLRELAYAACAGASVFLTYDPSLLKLDDALYSEFGLSVQRPASFISRLNEFEKEREYQPARFRGSSLENRRAKGSELDQLAARFQQPSIGERKAALRERLAKLLATPTSTALKILLSEEKPVLLFSERVLDTTCLVAEIIRTEQSMLSMTLAHLLVSELLRQAITQRLELIRVEDQYVSTSLKQALRGFHFQEKDGVWHRAVLQGMQTAESVVKLLDSRSEACRPLSGFHGRLVEDLERCFAYEDWSTICSLEQAIWPAKVAGTSVPCYIIPIRPLWAAQLFDSRLAGSRLLPADAILLLRSENVYYTAAPCKFLVTPSRILWYVSHDKRFQGSKAIRCASTLQEVAIGPAQDIYRQYRRLGVYKWEDVARVARSDGTVTALVFGRAEPLGIPIGYEKLCSVLDDLGERRKTFQSPTRIETGTYDSLFESGWN
jgi:GNAT superfamily N-acetyltransferase/predicted nucleic acid-binding protein